MKTPNGSINFHDLGGGYAVEGDDTHHLGEAIYGHKEIFLFVSVRNANNFSKEIDEDRLQRHGLWKQRQLPVIFDSSHR